MSINSFAETGKGGAQYDLDGMRAVVTGGAAGIGQDLVAALRRSGAEVTIWDSKAAPDAPDQIQCDVTSETSVAAALEETLRRHGRIDVLVNSAGISGNTLPVAEFPVADWDKIIAVNLRGVFLTSKAVSPSMVAAGWGRIVNVASLAGKEGTPNSAAYSASKAGVIALTKALGKELATTGVLVNAVAPAAIKTELLNQMQPEHVQTMIGKSPMKRLGEVSEVSELILWLCSKSCTFNTGAIFDLSGGRATY